MVPVAATRERERNSSARELEIVLDMLISCRSRSK
jgi:pilus assembly protein TadC